MVSYVMNSPVLRAQYRWFQEYGRVVLLAGTAVALSAATIIYYNHKMYFDLIEDVYNKVELTTITLMPYMISAVVATITAIGIMSMLPMLRSAQAAGQIYRRVKQLSDGDLTTTSRLDTNNEHLKDVANELNYAVGFLGSSVAQWKIINRQQWDLLEGIRQATLQQDHLRALKMIEKMEDNWRLTASIENRFRT